MVPATAQEIGANQSVAVIADDDVERVMISLVGDLASYRPHGKVVILEGKAEHGFDVTMVKRLFPDFARRVNLISGGHKQSETYTRPSNPLPRRLESRIDSLLSWTRMHCQNDRRRQTLRNSRGRVSH